MNISYLPREYDLNRLSKTRIQKPTNRFFQTKSPTCWSIISDHYQSSSSSSSPHNQLSNDKSTRTYRLIVVDEQKPLDGRYVIPTDNSQLPKLVDSSSQTSSRHTYPFNYTPDSNNITLQNSPRELTEPGNIDQQSSLSSSLERFSPHDRFPLPLGKTTISMKEDDISTNYDSDDGWSDDSAELIYIDERYITPKKKIIASSSSHLISQQEQQQQQQNVFLQ
jgi:hypothetical protein